MYIVFCISSIALSSTRSLWGPLCDLAELSKPFLYIAVQPNILDVPLGGLCHCGSVGVKQSLAGDAVVQLHVTWCELKLL